MTEERKENTVQEETVEELFDEAIENIETEELATEMTAEETLLNETITELEEKLEEAENQKHRAQADLANYRRRAQLDKEAAHKYRAQGLITDILPVLDNFERALVVENPDEKTASFLQGMEMVYRQLIDALTKEGLEAIDAVGTTFDPNVHQAIMQVEDENYEANIVVEEFQKGYKLKDRVIRPSMVKVNQ